MKNMCGHSLGGATGLELAQNFPATKYKVNTYGAPVATTSTVTCNRYRNQYDPVSMFDNGAQTSSDISTLVNPHGYDTFEDTKVSDKTFSSFVYRTDS